MNENQPFLCVNEYQEINDLWHGLGVESQIFYDKASPLLILRNKSDIFFLRPNEIKKSQKFQLKTKM